MNAKLHNGPDAPVVRLRWVFTDQPFLPIGTQCVINNRIWNEDYYSDLAVGQLPDAECDYIQDARWKLPAFKFDGHQCNPQWFSTGEPWPVPPTLPPTVSLAGWIPECCVMACDFEDCSREPVNGKPASQQRQYTVPVVDAVAGTPFRQYTVAEALDSAGGFWPGRREEWFPLGTLGPAQFVVTDLTRPDGSTYSHAETINLGAGQFITNTQSDAGQTTTINLGGVTFSFALSVFAGQGRLTGINLAVDPAILPAGLFYPGQETLTAGGTDQATATPITQSNVTFHAAATPAGLLLPSKSGAVVWLKQSLAPHLSTYLYPPVGERINGAPVDTPLEIGPFPGHDAVWVATRTDEVDGALPGPYWTVVLVQPSGGSFALLNAPNVFTQPQTVEQTTAATNTTQDVLVLGEKSSGTAANGFGEQIAFDVQTSTGALRRAGVLECRWSTANDATRKGEIRLRVFDTAARTGISVRTDGANPMLGFFGVGATTRPVAGGSIAGFTPGVGAPVTDDATFTGGGAGGAYTIDDLVFALKSLGLLS